MDPSCPTPVTAFLENAVSSAASSQAVADAVITAFEGIDEVLTPIVGGRGVAALYKRTVHLARPSHPWLTPFPEGLAANMDLSALRTTLGQQRTADAAAAGVCLLETFHRLLSSLIGPSLTERLLRSVWASCAIEPPARDTPTLALLHPLREFGASVEGLRNGGMRGEMRVEQEGWPSQRFQAQRSP